MNTAGGTQRLHGGRCTACPAHTADASSVTIITTITIRPTWISELGNQSSVNSSGTVSMSSAMSTSGAFARTPPGYHMRRLAAVGRPSLTGQHVDEAIRDHVPVVAVRRARCFGGEAAALIRVVEQPQACGRELRRGRREQA